MPVGHLYVLSGKMCPKFLNQFLKLDFFFFLLLSCMSSSYILDIKPLSDVSFAKGFFHSGSCLFVLLTVSFTVQDFLVWCSSVCLPVALVWGDRSKIKMLLRSVSESILPMFSFRSFMNSGLTFKSLNPFEFIFVYAVRKWSSFILLLIAVQFFKHCLLKRLSFPHCIVLSLLS